MKLIDADELTIKLQARRNNIENNIEDDLDKGFALGIGVAMNLIHNAPTVDIKDIYQEGHYDGHLEGYTKAINEERHQGEWVSVSERLPENRNLVLVTAYWHETYQVMQASYFGEGEKNGWWCVPWNNCGEHMRNDLHVIAWQELPKPYKKGGAE